MINQQNSFELTWRYYWLRAFHQCLFKTDDNVYYDDSVEPSSYLLRTVILLTVDSDDDYDVDDYAEQMNWYTSGRLYPICIGDVLAEKYRIEHRLLLYGLLSTRFGCFGLTLHSKTSQWLPTCPLRGSYYRLWNAYAMPALCTTVS